MPDSELGNAQVRPQVCHWTAITTQGGALLHCACCRASSESRAGKSATLESAAAVWTRLASFIEIGCTCGVRARLPTRAGWYQQSQSPAEKGDIGPPLKTGPGEGPRPPNHAPHPFHPHPTHHTHSIATTPPTTFPPHASCIHSSPHARAHSPHTDHSSLYHTPPQTLPPLNLSGHNLPRCPHEDPDSEIHLSTVCSAGLSTSCSRRLNLADCQRHP